MLAGRELTFSSAVVAFGAGTQTGDIIIGDVAGSNLVKLHIDLSQTTINTEGGDYAEGSIDKRQGTFVENSTVHGDVIGEKHEHYYPPTAPTRTSQEQRNRLAMLAKVRNIWIDGFLHKSLTDALRIELNLVDRPDVVDIPLNALYQEWGQAPEPLPAGTGIVEVFDQAGGELLILGAPGAGKTTLLLELLRDLLTRAERDEAHPIPIIFPLSTWAAERKPFKDWLVEQLNVIYDVPRKIGQGWVTESEVLTLLDGLDEVAAEHRDACVEAINRYRQEVGGLVPTAVASRVLDYEALKRRLRLKGAVLVELLTRQQVKAYLEQVGEPLKGVRELVEADHEVMEIIDSPLMLSVVTLSFQNAPVEALRVGGTVEERRGRLWEAYIERMFSRKRKETKYNRQQTVRWLSSLSRQMQRQGQTAYYIEQMQPNLLERRTIQIVHMLIALVISLVSVAIVMLVASLILGVAINSIANPLILGNATGILAWFVLGIYGGMLSWLVFAITGTAQGNAFLGKIEMVENVRWSGRGAWVAISVFAICTLAAAIRRELFLFGAGLAFSAFLGVMIATQAQEPAIRKKPNQGIWRSLLNSLRLGFLAGLPTMILGGFASTVMAEGWVGGVALGYLAASIVFGVGLVKGGGAFVKHFALRFLLYYGKALPFFLRPWLDYCVDHLFLRRIGGGYTFVHRMLLEHFAAKYEEPTK